MSILSHAPVGITIDTNSRVGQFRTGFAIALALWKSGTTFEQIQAMCKDDDGPSGPGPADRGGRAAVELLLGWHGIAECAAYWAGMTHEEAHQFVRDALESQNAVTTCI